ncbi:hypothetical protein ACG0Z6_02975 [Roseateles sp. BYS180W]|uniref:Toxin CptA n=1 Tax=Roseateles rivi TaxID=3299028 RepID=A0ABW7FSC0_9BURK
MSALTMGQATRTAPPLVVFLPTSLPQLPWSLTIAAFVFAVLLHWLASLYWVEEGQWLPPLAVALVGAAAMLLLAWRLRPRREVIAGRQLLWDGQGWFYVAGEGACRCAVDVDVRLDLNHWMLLRLVPQGASAWRWGDYVFLHARHLPAQWNQLCATLKWVEHEHARP